METGFNWHKGDILETADGRQFKFGHYEGLGFWVHRITKAGKMDKGSKGKYISRDGVKPATLDVSKRGGWPTRKTAPHRWGGAGYICVDCGSIKDGDGGDDPCPGGEPPKKVRLYLAKFSRGRRCYYPVGARNPVEAAELFLAHLIATGTTPRYHDYIMLDEYQWDGTPGFKIATDTNGDIRYDIRAAAGGGFFPVHSEMSYA